MTGFQGRIHAPSSYSHFLRLVVIIICVDLFCRISQLERTCSDEETQEDDLNC